jgi:hypothetical protein
MAAIGGRGDETPRSGGKAQRGEADAPGGGGGSHRSRARSSSAIRNRQRGLGLGLDREGRRVRGRLAGPSRSSQAHSGGLTSGPRLSAQPV